jgi:hypothetical protein
MARQSQELNGAADLNDLHDMTQMKNMVDWVSGEE